MKIKPEFLAKSELCRAFLYASRQIYAVIDDCDLFRGDGVGFANLTLYKIFFGYIFFIIFKCALLNIGNDEISGICKPKRLGFHIDFMHAVARAVDVGAGDAL